MSEGKPIRRSKGIPIIFYRDVQIGYLYSNWGSADLLYSKETGFVPRKLSFKEVVSKSQVPALTILEHKEKWREYNKVHKVIKTREK